MTFSKSPGNARRPSTRWNPLPSWWRWANPAAPVTERNKAIVDGESRWHHERPSSWQQAGAFLIKAS